MDENPAPVAAVGGQVWLRLTPNGARHVAAALDVAASGEWDAETADHLRDAADVVSHAYRTPVPPGVLAYLPTTSEATGHALARDALAAAADAAGLVARVGPVTDLGGVPIYAVDRNRVDTPR